MTCAGSSRETQAISGEPGVACIGDRSQDGPVRGCEQPTKTDCVICATKDLHSLDKTPVREHSVDLPHQLFRRCTVLLWIESGGGNVLSHKPVSSPVQSAEETHFPPAQGTLTIDQDPERPSVHFHSPNSATVCSGAALKIHHSHKPSARYWSFRARISAPGPHARRLKHNAALP
jgi:hypothetical protein